MIKFSIITAVYNNRTQIADCIRSVASQSYSQVEHILVDGGSSDGTLEIIKANQTEKLQWISESDQGIYHALNKGIQLASGDVIGFLHSDDLFFDTETLRTIASGFQENRTGAVYGDLLYVSRNDTQKVVRYWKSKPFTAGLLKQGWMPPHPALFVKKKWFDQLGGFRSDFKISADYDFILRLFKENDLDPVYIPKVFTRMRMGGASNRSIRNVCRKSYEDYISIKENKIGGFFTLGMKNTQKMLQFFRRPEKSKIEIIQ